VIYINSFSARIVNIWNNLQNSIVEAFKAHLIKIWSTETLSLILQPA